MYKRGIFLRACLRSPGSSENDDIRVEINENLRLIFFNLNRKISFIYTE